MIFGLALNTAEIDPSVGVFFGFGEDQRRRGIKKRLANRVTNGFQGFGGDRANLECFSDPAQDKGQDGNKKNEEKRRIIIMVNQTCFL